MLLRRISFFVLIASALLHADWAKTTGPDSVRTFRFGYTMLENGSGMAALFVGTKNRIFRSVNNGDSWINVSAGLTGDSIGGIILLRDTVYTVVRGGGVFRSGSGGMTWSAINTGLTSLNVRAILVSGTTLFVGTDEGKIFHSDNRGANWNLVGLDSSTAPINALTYYSSGLQGGLYAATDEGLFISTDGPTWSSANSGLASLKVSAFVWDGSALYSATGAGIYRRSHSALPPFPSWSKVEMVTINSPTVLSLASMGTNTEGPTPMIAGTREHGIFYSASGFWWTQINQGLSEMEVQAVHYANQSWFAGTNGGLWRRHASEVSVISNELENKGISLNFRIREDGHVLFTLPARMFVSLKIFDPQGKRVSTLLTGEFSAGAHALELKGSALPNGLYAYQLKAGDIAETRKIVLGR